ncbi:MAG: cation:proton antiporter, partial [Corynebacterium flavescens]
MEVLLVLIGLMLLTVVVVAVGDKIGLPWPALLTILTAVAVFTPALPSLNVPAELILPIFLPPLLWALARRTSWGVIREQWVTILSLSVLLVVATTFAVGLTAFAFLPGLGFAGAILIGAAIAPPDPVAVEAVAEPAGIPRRIISALQTEGLFNDAASIVAFHLALMA